MSQLQMNFEQPQAGAVLRDVGMQRSVEKADRVVPGWKDSALKFVRSFPSDEFMTEQVREYAYALGLPKPPNERAWGAVIMAAKKLGLIVFARFEQVGNPRAHRTPASVWRRVQ